LNEVLATRTLDCANRLRVHYRLSAALELAFLELHFPGLVRVEPFSKFVAGAHDHASVHTPRVLHLAGALGERRLVVTYGKGGDEAHHQVVERIEALLTRSFGPVRYAPRREVLGEETDAD
jgi:hypothetical protein